MATAPVDVQVAVKGLSDLQKLERRMEALEKDVVKLNKTLPQTANAIQKTGRAAGTATGNIQRMGIAFRTTLAPIVAVYGAFNFLNKSLQVASQRQVNVAKLTNGLRNLGGTAADLEDLVAAADKFGRSTLFDQEDATNAFALLTSFQRIGVDSYERVTKAASDLATVTGQDLKSAQIQLAKALEDPAKRVTDLARSGTVFTDQQKEQIKVLQESGRLYEAQNLILKEIEKQYGGAAEAAGSAGLAGALDTLGEATRDFQEQLVAGTGAINLAESAIYALADAVDFATTSVRDFQTLVTALDSIIRNLDIGLDGLAGVFEIVNDAIIRSIPGLREAIFAYEQLLKLAGKYNDSQAGPRNFGDNYASQERRLFKAAGGYLPPRTTFKPDDEDKDEPKKTRGGKTLSDGTKELRTLQQQIALLETKGDLERSLLEIRQKEQNAIIRIQETVQAGAQAQLIELERLKAKKLELQLIEQFTNNALASAESLIDSTTRQVEADARRRELIAQGINPALADQLVAIEQNFDKERDLLGAKVKELEASLALVDAESEKGKKIQENIDKQKEYLGLLDKSQKDAEDNAKENNPDDPGKIESYMKQLEEDLADTEGMIVSLAQTVEAELGSAMSNAISGIIDGTQTAEEAFAQMFQAIGKAFIDLATQMIAKALIMKALGILFPGAGGGGGFGGGGYFDSITGKGIAGPNFGLASGGYVNEPTQAMIGEGGDDEYVIPSGKMESAMQRYSAGARGDAVVNGADPSGGGDEAMAMMSAPINISTGPVMAFEGSNYVSQEQFAAGVQSAAKQGEARALRKLQMSPAARRKAGI